MAVAACFVTMLVDSFGYTGFVIDPATDAQQVSTALVSLLSDAALRGRMGSEARARAVREFRYDVLTDRLAAALDGVT
jgi:glycosyltransferase involved in cell wall biosynthesis